MLSFFVAYITDAGAQQLPGANTGSADINAEKQLLDPALLEQNPRENPFQSLVEPKEEEKPQTPVAAALPAINPLTGYSLSGIIYKGKNSLAILGVPGGKSKIVHVGQVLESPEGGGSVEVSRIDKTSVILSILGASSDMPEDARSTTLKMASLIGYKSSGSSGGGSSKKAPPPAAAPGNAPGSPGASAATPAGAPGGSPAGNSGGSQPAGSGGAAPLPAITSSPR